MATPNAHAPLGSGGRFAALESQLARRPGVRNPAALAASIGRKKYGAKRFAALGKKPRTTPKAQLGAHITRLRAAGAFSKGKTPAAPGPRSKFAGD